MQIPLVDLKAQFEPLKSEVMQAVEEVLSSMHLFLGENTQLFEEEFAAYCGAKASVGVANGTDALHLALRAAGVGHGHEVITVSHTFFATAEAIVMAGAAPVFVDIDPATLTIDVAQIEAKITAQTRAIVPVHLYGRLCDMEPIMELAERHGLIVIEDAAQAHGAEFRGKRAGSFGHLGCFSFYYSKNLGAYGEAGAVTTSDPRLADRLRVLRDHGSKERYYHSEFGFNGRIDEIQAAILRIKLRHLDAWNARRRQHAARYSELLAASAVQPPSLPSDSSHVYHLYVIRTTERDALQRALREQGIATGIHYPVPVHLQEATRALGYRPGHLPNTERAAREVLSLPMYAELDQDQIAYVAQHVRSAAQRDVSATLK
jgi:dTDP-4-amino-4,6-dideoxygalactose transaminase